MADPTLQLAILQELKNLRVVVQNSSSIQNYENGVTTKVSLFLGDVLISESEDRTSIYHMDSR